MSKKEVEGNNSKESVNDKDAFVIEEAFERLEEINRLLENPPKMVIWHNMNDSNWSLLEQVFRNGERSGQRDIKEKFYEGYMLSHYTMLHEYDNHRDGTIQVWLRN